MTDVPTRAASGRQRVLVVGIDGVRFDRLGDADTPTIQAIGRAGFLAALRVHDAGPTISGPCWAGIATGTPVTVHGILDNDTPPAAGAQRPPDFLTCARRAGLRAYAAAAWPPLLRAEGCGPIFDGGGDLTVDHELFFDLPAWEIADDAVVDRAGAALAGGDIAAAFVYLGLADETAHVHGCGAEYAAAIRACDARLARLLAAIGFQPGGPGVGGAGNDGDGWAVIVVTDHGHRDEGGHGGDSDAERTAWIAAAGPTMPTVPPAHLEQVDVHAQVLASLGIPIALPADPAFGRQFGRRG